MSIVERSVENPLRAGLRVGGATVPAAFVIFGATGDLAQRKLLPAIYNLGRRGLLPARFSLVGYARTEMTDEQYRNFCHAAIESHSRTPIDEHYWPAFAAMLRYHVGGFDDDADFASLGDLLGQVDIEYGTEGNRVYYLSTPSKFFPVILQRMGAAKLNRPPGFARVVIEKPFGNDLGSARELAAIVHKPFREEQIYRIDHYLGKETVQNIFAFRFANAIFEPVWNNTYVDHVQITVAESIGVEHRAAFYEETGVVRDIVQNHLLQVLALVAMEPPSTFEADPVRDEKIKLLRAVMPMTFEQSVRGSTRRGSWPAAAPMPTSPNRGSRPSRPHRPTSPRSFRSRTGAGPDAVLHPCRQAFGQARDRDRGAVSAAAAPAVHAACRRASRAELAGTPDPARRGHLAAIWRQGGGIHALDPHRQHGLPVRLAFMSECPRPTRL